MGELQTWIPQSNGVLGDYNPPSSPFSHPPNPHPSEIGTESWWVAEEATQRVIENIQPTVVSEERRKAVVEYVQKLIRGLIGSEVFPFGSVPLKTYLPDGDIDLTALGLPNNEDNLASDVRSVLETEEQKKDAEFQVKDVQYIHAEVKLIKCLVQNIVVDISFNQLGGLCTLCFLEQVDRLIGKEHLFKRSIILIKAWCYYESRILGAHHGLISTYALETLVLYIFHLFHTSLDGPLAVLYRFLDYYSKFDWDNYCISLSGPVSISSLPELVAEAPENDGADLLLAKEFLKSCVDMFSVPPRGLESNSRQFPQKFLNIVDPLKENNNLGRSVSKGNFYRIRSAFSYGARKLGRILLLPSEVIADEVNMFFTNTMERHGSGERPDVQDPVPRCPGSSSIGHIVIASVTSGSKLGVGREDELNLPSPAATSHGELSEGMNNIKLLGLQKENVDRVESDGLEGSGRLVVDAKEAIRASGPSNSRERSKASPSTLERGNSPAGKPRDWNHAPHLFFRPENRNLKGAHDQSNVGMVDSVPSSKPLPGSEGDSLFVQPEFSETGNGSSWMRSRGSLASSWNTNAQENSYLGECSLAGDKGNEANGHSMSNKLPNLSGDYDTHIGSLQYAQWWQESMVGTLYLPVHHSSPYQYRNRHSWDPLHRRNVFTHMNSNAAPPGPPLPPGSYPITHPFISGAYGMEDSPKPRGTGTYFPIANYRNYRDRGSPGRARNPSSPNHFPRNRNNGRVETPQDTSLQEKRSHEPPQLQLPAFAVNGRGKPASLDVSHTPRPILKGTTHTNGFTFPPEGRLEFGSLGPVQLGAPPSELGRKSDSVSPHTMGSGPGISSSPAHRSLSRERSAQSYQLKDDGDFPPLTG